MSEDNYNNMADGELQPLSEGTLEVIQQILKDVQTKHLEAKDDESVLNEYRARIELICRYFKANSSPSSIPNLSKVVSNDVTAAYPSGVFKGKQVYLEHCTKSLGNSKAIFSLHRVSLRPDEFTLDLNAERAFARWNFEYKVKGCGCCGKPGLKYGFNVFEFTKEDGELKISFVRTVVL
jgi:hypothetical protein